MKSISNSNEVMYEDAPADVAEAVASAEKNNLFMSLDEVLARSKKERITLNVDSDVVSYFRRYAKEHGAKYQTLMNEVLRGSVEKQLLTK